MPAKSIVDSKEVQGLSPHANRIRSALSALVLGASLAALALILRDQSGSKPWWPVTEPMELTADRNAFDEITAKSPTNREVERDRAISEFLARRYRVSQEVTLEYVRIAFAAGQHLGVDPLLIIAVMAVESSLNPIAESGAGAKGLMQIIPRFHVEKFEAYGGEKAVFDPSANILVGSQILSEYIRRTGDVSLGLQIYAGGPSEGETPYPAKVLGEKRRLQQIVSRYLQQAPRAGPSARVAL
jgi:soluble lytic murein transglycosylase-like protein